MECMVPVIIAVFLVTTTFTILVFIDQYLNNKRKEKKDKE